MEEVGNLAQQNEKLVENLNTELSKLGNNFELPSLLHLMLATAFLAFVFYSLSFIFKKLNSYTDDLKRQYLKPVTFKNIVLVGQHNLATALDFVFGVIKFSINLFLIYAYLTYAFGIFPATRGIASKLLNYVIHLALNGFDSVISFIPNLLTIVFIITVTYYFLKLGKFVSRSLYFRQIIFPGFKQEWIMPTYDIARFFIVVFAVIMVFPYLPGSDSPAFKGVSVFLGVLFTLGSSSAIGNIVAGVVLIYMSPFKVGDRVKVGDIVGDITEMSLLVTRLRTVKNEDVTIPNSHILTQETVNYSSSAKLDPRLIIPIIITIGYEVPREDVKNLLLKSTEGIESILNEPSSFVLVNELGGSYISYELNVHTDQAQNILQIKSDLRESIIDKFNEAGVEILSPQYISMRDGNKPKLAKETN